MRSLVKPAVVPMLFKRFARRVAAHDRRRTFSEKGGVVGASHPSTIPRWLVVAHLGMPSVAVFGRAFAVAPPTHLTATSVAFVPDPGFRARY